LYIEGGPKGPMVIAVTESNNVYALNADTGLPIWSRTDIGPPVQTTPCGGFNPTGITGTPVVDVASGSLFFDALIDGSPNKHFIYSLNVDTGVTTPGWPVDVNATASYNGIDFVSLAQEERGGLALVNGIVYVSYSGYLGDCGNYHGWVVGVDINNPLTVGGWATTAIGGGIWGHGGVASDGTNMFVVTGNTFNTGGNWMGGEAIIRLQAGPTWTGQPTDYWVPTNWFSLDNSDTDLGGVSATVVDVPGATPSQLVLALGKDSNAFLLNRNNGTPAWLLVAAFISAPITRSMPSGYRQQRLHLQRQRPGLLLQHPHLLLFPLRQQQLLLRQPRLLHRLRRQRPHHPHHLRQPRRSHPVLHQHQQRPRLLHRHQRQHPRRLLQRLEKQPM